MQEEEELVGSLANRMQADDDEGAESNNGKGSDLDKFRVERSCSQARQW